MLPVFKVMLKGTSLAETSMTYKLPGVRLVRLMAVVDELRLYVDAGSPYTITE